MEYECDICSKKFRKTYVLYRHVRTVHKLHCGKVGSIKCQERGCEGTFNTIVQLRQHLVTVHEMKQFAEELSLSFKNMCEFKDWLQEEERASDGQFACPRGAEQVAGSGKTVITYTCRRSGSPRILEEPRQRAMKMQGTCKVGFHCTAQIKVSQFPDKVEVIYLKNHYKHDHLLGHMVINKNDRQVIASKLLQGVTERRILQDIRESVDDKVNRLHLATLKDLHNIKQSFGVDVTKIKGREPDHLSVQMWIQKMKENQATNPVILYKEQGEDYPGLQKDDFVLVIMTTFQKDMFMKFGHDRICIDSTHGLTGYDFELTTVMVVDEYEEGFPVSFCFSNTVNTSILTAFFNSLKELLGSIDVKTFMTDDAPMYFNAWCQVMGSHVQNRLLCAWHVDRSWQGHLSAIGNKEKCSAVYKSLKACMMELEKDKFHSMFQELMEQLQADPETEAFHSYLEKFYKNRTETWAYCYRIHAKINTNMHIENFHRNIKHIYLAGKKHKRLDKCIDALNTYLLDKQFDTLVKLHKGKLTTKISSSHSRHQLALALKDSCKVVKHNEEWEMLSSSQELVHRIKRKEHLCTEMCSIICKECKICIENFSCSCQDYIIKNNMCKHVHAVGMFLNSHITHTTPMEPINQDEMLSVEKYANVKEKTAFHQTLLRSVGENNLLDSSNYVTKITDLVASISAKIHTSSMTQEIAKAVYSHLLAANELLSVPQACFSVPFPTNGRHEPENKNVTKQKSFFPTKKKRVAKERLAKPSTSEVIKIENILQCQLPVVNNRDLDHSYV